MKKILIVFTAIFAVFAVFAAHATTIVPQSIEQLTHDSSRVVQGQVISSYSAWNAEHTRIYTYSRVKVTNVMKGGSDQEITVIEVGGNADGYTMRVSGVHPLVKGEEAVLFLNPGPPGTSTWAITGLMQGHFRMQSTNGQKFLSNGIHQQSIRMQNGAITATSDKLTIDEMKSRVRKAISSGGQNQ